MNLSRVYEVGNEADQGIFTLIVEWWDLLDAAFLDEKPRGIWLVPLHQKVKML